MCIGINFVELTIEALICFYFLHHYLGDRIKGVVLSLCGFAALMMARISYMIYDYYIFREPVVFFAWAFLYAGIVMLAIALFWGVSRSIFKEFPHRNIYFASIGAYSICLGCMRYAGSLLLSLASVVGFGMLLMVPLCFQFNKLVSKVGGYIKRYFGIAVIGLPLAYFGIGLGSIWRDLPEFDGWVVKGFSHIIFVVGIALFGLALVSLPSLSEFDWENRLIHLYVIAPSGLCIYSYSFKRTEAIEPQLLTNSLTGLIAMVKEMTNSKKHLRFIRQEDKHLYLTHGDRVRVAVLAEDELRIVFDKSEKFIREFELIFSTNLEYWTGNTEEFKIATMLVRENFTN